jgi:DNA-binding response OmpR family regulator
MIKKVLIVDDDLEMLLSLKEGLGRYDETFAVLTAMDGEEGLDQLKKNPVSLVVTDLKMPKMDGFSFLGQIMEHYPEIPVIITTGYSTPEMEKMAREGGAVGYISKPFMLEDLARKIMTALRREDDGGTLHSVSSGLFLQLMEMEERTCTIRLFEKMAGKQGILFFKEGELLDARTDRLRGEEAAYEIFSWEEVSLSIQNSCQQKEKKIGKDLQAILLESARLKDERSQQGRPEAFEEGAPPPPPVQAQARKEPSAKSAKEVKKEPPAKEAKKEPSTKEAKKEPSTREAFMAAIDKELGRGSGVMDIYYDDSWAEMSKAVIELGELFMAGQWKSGFIDKGGSNDFILVPRDKMIVMSVNPRCPRDRIMDILEGR